MRAQAATEYILVSAIGLLIIVPATFFFFQFSQSQTKEFESSQVLRIGDRLSLATQTVFNNGYGSRTTLTERFPVGIVNITFEREPVGVGGEYVITYDPEFSGRLQVYGFPVNVPVFIDTTNVPFGEGQKRLRLDVLENTSASSENRFYVNVTVS